MARRLTVIATAMIRFCVVFLFLGSLLFIEKAIEQVRSGASSAEYSTLRLPDGAILKKLAALGYEQVVADFFWLRAIQHIGDDAWAERGYPHLYPLLDNVTELDPQFSYAYQVGGVILGIVAHRTEESMALLKKGLKNNPTDWRIPFHLGFQYFDGQNDYKKAADFMAMASALPGRPDFLPQLTARLYAEARDPQTAIDFLIRLYNSTTDERAREKLKIKMGEMVIERDLLQLEESVQRYLRTFRRYPDSLEQTGAAGFIQEIPKEPFGGQYYLDLETGEVKSSTHPVRLRLYRKPE